MMRRAAPGIALVLALGVRSFGQAAPESVYAPPELPRPDQGVNEGAVHFGLGLSYFTDYVYRGVEVFEVPAHEDSLNLQIDTKLSFDLGKLPHPYVAVFANIADSDPLSNFQEIRPTVGFDWTIKPLVISGGYTTYLYPERDQRQTSEVFMGLALDEKTLYHGDPIPVPYIMAAYDFDLYNGVYVEAGLRYRYAFDEIGLTLTGSASVAYVAGYTAYIDGDNGSIEPGFFTSGDTARKNINGLQHYQVGLTAEYSLNKLFNVSTRYGDFALRGSVYYTDGIDDAPAATTQIWGGAGIVLSY
ncbi:MAG: hypothetical protein JWM57_2993 [Phycisphaerales bacterium]|nr:hypothetical protein [Phycisphaerales bacterium]